MVVPIYAYDFTNNTHMLYNAISPNHFIHPLHDLSIPPGGQISDQSQERKKTDRPNAWLITSGSCRTAVDQEFENIGLAKVGSRRCALEPKALESTPWDHPEGSQSQLLGASVQIGHFGLPE